jgi:hypothetical protein
VAGCCDYGNEQSGFIKCGEFVELAEELSSSTRRTVLG